MVVICSNRELLREWLAAQCGLDHPPRSFGLAVEEALRRVEVIAHEREGTNYRLVENLTTWIGVRHGSTRFPVYLAHIQDAQREATTCQLIVQSFLESVAETAVSR